MSKSGNTVKSGNLAIPGSGQNLVILAIFGDLVMLLGTVLPDDPNQKSPKLPKITQKCQYL